MINEANCFEPQPSGSLAAVILTKNEARDIGDCVRSCRFADAVIVLDSCSEDDTVALAREAGGLVYQRPFTNYAEQRNAAIDLASGFEWVLMMDADERVPQDMAEEVREIVAVNESSVDVWRIRRKDFFFGRWLQRATGYPTWACRLMRPGRVRFVREINEQLAFDGKVRNMQTHFHHFPFSKGLAAWAERHNKYSTMEASRLVAGRDLVPRVTLRELSDSGKRRQMLKWLFYRLPFRSTAMFLALYVVRLGILDGWAGLQYCRLRSWYEYMIYLKSFEEGKP